ncbi:2-succinyl-6-hydroxy-2,4-cyclohexadiene-1-carboxylate synthase [Leuconostoc palmae]|uniref:2-succinyl-6-hydroxy-2, 4-cyclohexadiene-1-carboxylate synthase n=1 Tax=Leuconostoc palmae TaxID=501487 RepID=UPI001C7CC2E0|nr:2-succinyl-6-hydroxy-2,4-cyclohexadiene-1-carboxylate synthase [Leuconostoc palmae]
MHKIISINQYPYEVMFQRNTNSKQKWLLLHGFMGSMNDFDTIKDKLPGQVMLINLLGFGRNVPTVNDPEKFKMKNQINDITMLLDDVNWQTFNLLGYSMGGRLALGLALEIPDRITYLFLESATAGISENIDREIRRKQDNIRANDIIENFENFVLQWEKLPLFKSQLLLPADQQQKMRSQRLNQNKYNVANSLVYMGTGSQPNFWNQISDLNVRVKIIVGEYDKKFQRIALKMTNMMRKASFVIIDNAGHNIHFEQPDEMIKEMINVCD